MNKKQRKYQIGIVSRVKLNHDIAINNSDLPEHVTTRFNCEKKMGQTCLFLKVRAPTATALPATSVVIGAPRSFREESSRNAQRECCPFSFSNSWYCLTICDVLSSSTTWQYNLHSSSLIPFAHTVNGRSFTRPDLNLRNPLNLSGSVRFSCLTSIFRSLKLA